MKYLSRTSGFLIFCVGIVSTMLVQESAAVRYLKPDENRELFKLEKVPLQINRLNELSNHLVTLARRDHDGAAEEQRASAQLIALAMRLDPSGQRARETNRELQGSKQIETSSPDDLAKAKARVRFFKRWLAHPDAGADANKLSDYLEDATRVLDPKRRSDDDLGNWKNVVPALKEYPGQGEQPTDRENERERPEDDGEMEDNDDAEDNDEAPEQTPGSDDTSYHLTELAVKAPFTVQNVITYRDKDDFNKEKKRTITTQKISTVSIAIEPLRGDKDVDSADLFRVTSITRSRDSGERRRDPIHRNLSETVLGLMADRHEGIGNARCHVTISGGSYGRSNEYAITAPVAIMMEASARNTPLRENLYVCARIDEEGKFHMQDNFWTSLKTLREIKDGGRLILPAKASSLLAQILVFGEPDFFTRWEVFAVDTLDDAMTIATEKVSDDLVKADKLFGTVTELSAKTDVTKLAVNRAVRARLAEVSKLSPQHMSSKALLLQGSGKRPMRLNKEALAHTIIPVVTKMHKALHHSLNADKITYTEAKDVHEEARKELDPLERLVDRSADDLYKEALDLANDFRSLGNIIRRANDRENRDEAAKRKVRPEFMRMARMSRELLKQLRIDAGYPVPEEDEEEEKEE